MSQLCDVSWVLFCCVFFFQAEDGIRDLVRSRGLGDVYKRQAIGRQRAHSHRQNGGYDRHDQRVHEAAGIAGPLNLSLIHI